MKKAKLLLLVASVCAMTSVFVACSKDDDEDKKVTCTCEYEDDLESVNPADYGLSTCADLERYAAARGYDYDCW